jgi:predicted kinase
MYVARVGPGERNALQMHVDSNDEDDCPELVVMVGCPLAGKTLHATQAFAKTHVVVGCNTMAIDRRRSHRRRENETQTLFLQAIRQGGRRIVVDACNASRASRAAYIRVGRDLGYRVSICFVDRSLTDVNQAIRGVQNRKQQRSYMARLQYFRHNFQFPTMEERVDRIDRVSAILPCP